MQAVVLAGGRGTRLRSRTGDLPKSLVDVGGRPLLDHQIVLAKRHGIESILILVNHAAERIVEFCNQRDNWGIDVRCVNDGAPRGTAGAVLSVFDLLDDDFLTIYGDTMLDIDLTRYNSPEYIKDAGTPERLDKVCADLESGRIARASLKSPQKAVFLDRDGSASMLTMDTSIVPNVSN